jgi:hypothetical protein
MSDDENKSDVRWENYRIKHFSFCINLFLTFAVAALGFTLSLIKDSGFSSLPGTGKALYLSVISFAGSIILGTVATLSRLLDFRCTVIKIRKKYSDFRQPIAEFLAEWLGGVSWSLFYLQLVTLAYGAFHLISSILTAYSDKFAK